MSEKTNETTALVPRQQGQELTPQIWSMLTSIGATCQKTGNMSLVNTAQGTIKAWFCWQHGLSVTAMSGLHFIKGNISAGGSVLGSLIRRHPNYDYKIEHHDEHSCTVVIYRFGEIEGRASYTMDEARAAKLTAKSNWITNSFDMLLWRAMARAQRFYAPDVSDGPLYTHEEMGDDGAGDWTIEGEVVEQKAAAPQRPKPPEFDQLIEKFGLDACVEAGALAATNESEVWTAVDKLANMAADAESQKLDAERAQEVAPTLADVVEEVEDGLSPFGKEAV